MDSRLEATADEKNFRKKIEHFIDVFMEQARNYPYLDIYMMSRLNDDVEKQNEILTDIKKTDKLKLFLTEIEEQMKLGTINKMPPVQFFINMLSLISYPQVMQPLLKKVFRYTDKQYQQMLAERKAIILKILFC